MRLAPRLLTSTLRVLPDFIIIGAQKAGTTSLYNTLCTHPDVRAAFRKEVHYFDLNYEKNIKWYRAFFPLSIFPSQWITGEASPLYFYLKEVPSRVRRTIPDVNLIVILRNPVDRFISHVEWRRRDGSEQRTIDEVLNDCDGQLDVMYQQEQMIIETADKRSKSYLSRGHYADQLSLWLNEFNRNQILILCSERLFANDPAEWDRICKFLDLRPIDMRLDKSNSNDYPAVSSRIRAILEEYYRPLNSKLYEMIDYDFCWNESITQ